VGLKHNLTLQKRPVR